MSAKILSIDKVQTFVISYISSRFGGTLIGLLQKCHVLAVGGQAIHEVEGAMLIRGFTTSEGSYTMAHGTRKCTFLMQISDADGCVVGSEELKPDHDDADEDADDCM